LKRGGGVKTKGTNLFVGSQKRGGKKKGSMRSGTGFPSRIGENRGPCSEWGQVGRRLRTRGGGGGQGEEKGS